MALEEYRKKRDFRKTPEPSGTARGKKAARAGLSFVIQKHAATRLHYDFRLELDGVLKSWAVPKGPSLDPGEKRLAVHVEDHPVDYGGFEGIIPKGQYGGGTVLLWDRGTWEPLAEDKTSADRDPAASYARGHLKFRLHGEKLHGTWALVKMGGRRNEGEDNWLLIKERDEEARPGSGDAIVVERPESVATGQSLEEIARDPARVWQSDRPAADSPAAAFKEKIRLAAEAAKKKTAEAAQRKTAEAAKKKTAEAAKRKTAEAVKRKPAEAAQKKTAGAARKKPAPGKLATGRKTAKSPVKKASAKRAAGKKAGAKRTEEDPGSSFDAAGIPGARRGPLPAGVEPQLATLVDQPPHGDGWIHEIKYDGYRALLALDGGDAHLTTRRGNDWTARFQPIATAAADLSARQALVDGEVVVQEPDGTTSFQALQNVLAEERQGELVYFAFDLLYLDGWDLRGAPLAERKRALEALLAGLPAGSPIRYGQHVLGRGDDFFREACGFGLEGIVAKRAALPYHPGRSKDWLKVKCIKRQELVVVGYTDPEGSRTGFGALLLAVHDDAGALTFAGKVGTGFDQAALVRLHRKLKAIERKTPAFANAPRGAEARRSHWVEPKLVAEVAFTEWTDEGILRHPSFQGLREDKDPAEIVRERPVPAAAAAGETAGAAAAAEAGAKPGSAKKRAAAGAPRSKKDEEIGGVRLTHPDRVLYPGTGPGQGLTKRDVALYYERVADRILPYLADRPLTLVRCPEGQGKECFYQKHVSDQFPGSIARVDVGEAEPYGALRDLSGILALVQMGVLEIHIWGSHVDRIEQPDYIVFDLDPDEGLAWERVVAGARAVKARLEQLGLQTFLKTTGGKGLHVVSPLVRKLEWDAVKAFTKAVSEAIVRDQPKLYTSMLPKARRQGKIFIDYLRNGRGATSISAYSTRARPGAPVSAPLFWEELDDPEIRGNTFTVENLPARLDSLKRDPWEGFAKGRRAITAKMLKALGVG
jgi:bifunctional non-homologous end joining protein LigD